MRDSHETPDTRDRTATGRRSTRHFVIATACAATLSALLHACSSPAAPTPPALKITSIAPNLGSTTGGTAVTVVGTEFGADTTLTVGGVAATKVTLQGTTTLTAVLDPHPVAGAADVVVSSGGKAVTLTKGFTFYAPTGSNAPPVVSSARTVGPRPSQPSGFANGDDSVTLIPTVSNAESGVTLTFDWSGPGTFTPTTDGTTTWHLPSSVNPAPQAMIATLVVTETFAEGAVTHMQTSLPFDFVMQLHDSQKEVLDMGEDFLTLFTRQLPGAQVLHNFSPTCDGGKGRSEEEGDGDTNRAEVIEDFNAFRISRRADFSINFKSSCGVPGKGPQLNTDACSSFGVHWEGIDRKFNARFIQNGIDYVSAVVENNQWKLCHSSFIGTETFPTLGITRAVSW